MSFLEGKSSEGEVRVYILEGEIEADSPGCPASERKGERDRAPAPNEERRSPASKEELMGMAMAVMGGEMGIVGVSVSDGAVILELWAASATTHSVASVLVCDSAARPGPRVAQEVAVGKGVVG